MNLFHSVGRFAIELLRELYFIIEPFRLLIEKGRLCDASVS